MTCYWPMILRNSRLLTWGDYFEGKLPLISLWFPGNVIALSFEFFYISLLVLYFHFIMSSTCFLLLSFSKVASIIVAVQFYILTTSLSSRCVWILQYGLCQKSHCTWNSSSLSLLVGVFILFCFFGSIIIAKVPMYFLCREHVCSRLCLCALSSYMCNS